MTATATQLRDQAIAADREAAASFERCDTDGFASQAASGLTADKLRLQARIVDNGGVWSFKALFDLDGNHVPAKEVNGAYGPVWMLLDADGNKTGWFNESQARNEATARTNNAKKGFYVGTVNTPAVAVLDGGGRGFAGMASVYAVVVPRDRDALAMGRDIEIVDNGQS